MENLVKKLEEQITFLQQEMSQMSNELYSQQKEIMNLKKAFIEHCKENKFLENKKISSYFFANATNSKSLPFFAIICIPIGSPSLLNPTGTDIVGNPNKLARAATSIQRWYVSSSVLPIFFG